MNTRIKSLPLIGAIGVVSSYTAFAQGAAADYERARERLHDLRRRHAADKRRLRSREDRRVAVTSFTAKRRSRWPTDNTD